MDLGNPLSGLFPVAEGKILTVMTRTNESLTGRDVARRVGGSHSTVLRGLNRLERQGLVQTEKAGNARLYSVNWGHLAIDPILDLVELKESLFAHVREQVRAWKTSSEKVSIFGSAARSDGGAESDVDILVVRPDGIGPRHEEWNDQVSDLSDSIFSWSGNRASIVEISGSTFMSWTASEPPLIAKEIARDEVSLIGPELRTLISGL